MTNTPHILTGDRAVAFVNAPANIARFAIAPGITGRVYFDSLDPRVDVSEIYPAELAIIREMGEIDGCLVMSCPDDLCVAFASWIDAGTYVGGSPIIDAVQTLGRDLAFEIYDAARIASRAARGLA